MDEIIGPSIQANLLPLISPHGAPHSFLCCATTMEAIHYWLRLHRAPKLSHRKTLECLHHFGDARNLCTATVSELQHWGMEAQTIQWLHSTTESKFVTQDLRWLEHSHHHLITCLDPAYPKLLNEIAAPPLLLFAAGNISLLNEPQLAVVGSRHPTANGIYHAHFFADSLARLGFLIVSGLAQGIDTVAHTAALDADSPTVAVIGTGPDRVYPRQNRRLAARIKEQGLIVSEFPCNTPPHPWNFPRRNRLISGLAVGTLVVEAAKNSGSLITAAHAREQNREVFAIPGSIQNPAVQGCHHLIQNGAKLIQTTEDVMIELANVIDLPRVGQTQRLPQGQPLLSEPCNLLLQYMEYENPITVDTLVERSQLTTAEVSVILLTLELEGYISSQYDSYTRLI